MLKVTFDITSGNGWISNPYNIMKKGIKSYYFTYEGLQIIQKEIFEYISIEEIKKEIVSNIKNNIGKKNGPWSFYISLDVDDDCVFLLTLKYTKEYLNSIGMIF